MQLNPIDVLIVPKSSVGIIRHYAIFLGKDEFGNEWVSENDKNEGVRLISAKEFFQKNPEILEIRQFDGSEQERKLALQRALKELGRPYQLMKFNCEHYANKVQKNYASSSQVQNFTKGAIAVGGILLLAKLFGDEKNRKA